ncbi:PQQ-binding-like beta-propeller repeat protein [Haloarcula salinisoli]|uniref:PQQ-like beta-propeller repeat protein n=1 Tax=Haloarcula salinisoli TaxID=2487746 RepID=A0A8J8CA99_9EURY|nr:PQQ-binding-like beta-propeller repeat protein [Halomicroarcula salinisoli]MBX0285709.1 PQQ-like beta-propeller repeat protein [Halomicroarcula salinisoli]MBX0302803.1 PQQ-like beta-propeller repeat protein [Halomicroarcula salinisoli]
MSNGPQRSSSRSTRRALLQAVAGSGLLATGVAEYSGSRGCRPADHDLSEQTGSDPVERWRFERADEQFSAPTVVDGTAYVGGESAIYAIDTSDGSQRWRFETDSSPVSAPTVADGTVFAADRLLYALDAEDGSVQWRYEPIGL